MEGDDNDASPAAYALVEVMQPADEMASEFRYFGLANAQGTLLLPLPYPPIPNPNDDDMVFPPLSEQTFNLTVAVHYRPSTQTTLPGSSVPNLVTLLNQDQATESVRIGTHFDDTAPDAGLQSVERLAVALKFDEPLVLRTAPGSLDADDRESVLRIILPTPA